jgi:hypothetical protein
MQYPHYYRSEKERPTGLSYSYSHPAKRYPYRPTSPLELEDITDTEDAQTVRATDFKSVVQQVEDLDKEDVFDFDLDSLDVHRRDPTPFRPISTPKVPQIPERKPKRVKKESGDSKTMGYTILTTLVLFISIHILPIVDWFPVLLRSRMGSHLSSGVLFSLCATVGHQMSQSRKQYYAYYRSMTRYKSYQSIKRLLFFIIVVYLTSFTTSYIFMGFFQLYMRVPLLGTMMVLLSLFWGSMLFAILSIWYAGKVSWSVANTVVKSPSKKPSLHIVG